MGVLQVPAEQSVHNSSNISTPLLTPPQLPRPDEAAQELVVFGWSGQQRHLRRLGAATLPLIRGLAPQRGKKVQLEAVPGCHTGGLRG